MPQRKTSNPSVSRLVRRHAETAKLMGVDFLPVGVPAEPGAEAITEAKPLSTAPAPSHDGSHPQREAKRAALATLQARYEREAPLPKQMPGWTNIVFCDGDPDAKLMFVGEAPGADEDRTGVPFVGRAGQKLNDMIRAMGLRREDVFIANVLKVRPPDNRTPTPDEAAMDGPYLREQIAIVKPRVIVALGKPAAQFLLNSRESMSALRGHWHSFEGIPVMPTYHPAFLLRQYTDENRRKVWSDLKQALAKVTDE